MAKAVHDSELPTPGQQVITVCAFIHETIGGVPKVFMPRRSPRKRFMPGVFNLPGGHVDFGENLIAGLKREIREELGMEIAVGEPFAAFGYANRLKGSHSVEIVYFARFISDMTDMVMDPDDHTEFKWVGLAEIATVYTELKGANDDEMVIVRRGLELLAGDNLNFG